MGNYIPSVITPGKNITFYVDGVPYQVPSDHPNHDEILSSLRSGDTDSDRLVGLAAPIQAIAAAVKAVEDVDRLPKGLVSVSRSSVTYNGFALSGVLVDRILAQLADGFDIMPMVRFLENLYQNPVQFARDELYLWLENSDLPITEDGHFLAYKKVRNDFKSVHDGKTNNKPGTVVSMPRTAVDPNRHNTCSTGLHFCSKSYLPSFGGEKVVLLKINPADVVSIPSDYNNAKGRAWQYEVLQEVDFSIPNKVWGSIVNSTGGKAVTPAPVEYFDAKSDLAKALFAALKEIGVDTSDRYERIEWANETLFELGNEPDEYEDIESYTELTVTQVAQLLDYARAKQAEKDARALQAVEQQKVTVKQAEVNAINSLGIEALRRKASEAGFSKVTGRSPYKQAAKPELVKFLIDRV